MQYRGLKYWAEKTQANNSVDGAENLTVTARWNCPRGNGSQLYYVAARFVHRDVGPYVFGSYYNAVPGPQARLTCN
jgi:hypothetical protein